MFEIYGILIVLGIFILVYTIMVIQALRKAKRRKNEILAMMKRIEKQYKERKNEED